MRSCCLKVEPNGGSSRVAKLSLVLAWLAPATVCTLEMDFAATCLLSSVFTQAQTSMHYFLSACVVSCLMNLTLASEERVAPRLARTTEEITKAVEGQKGFGVIQSVQFRRDGRQVFAVWYDPFSGRAACYLHAYYFDDEKARWIRFIDRVVEGTSDLSAEMPILAEVVIFKDPNEKVLVKESVARYPRKK